MKPWEISHLTAAEAEVVGAVAAVVEKASKIAPIDHARLTLSFREIHCVFMYFVKDLEHQRYVLNYPSRYQAIIHQYPHWMLSHYYRHAYYRFHRIDEKCPVLRLVDIENQARSDTGARWIVNGAKQSDSLHRNMMLGTLRFYSINETSERVYPLSLWKKEEVLSYIKVHRLLLPDQYGIGRSQGVDLKKDVLLYLKEKFPGDYKKIIDQFPFAEKLIYQNERNNEISEIPGGNY